MQKTAIAASTVSMIAALAGTAFAQEGVLFAAQDCDPLDQPVHVFDDGVWDTLFVKPYGVGATFACGIDALAVDQRDEIVYFAIGRTMGWWDRTTGSFDMAMGDLPWSIQSMAFDGNGRKLYAFGNNDVLYEIEPGTTSAVSVFTLVDGLDFGDLCWNPADESFYGYNRNGGGGFTEGVWRLDLLASTPGGELVSASPNPGAGLALAVWNDELFLVRQSPVFPSYEATFDGLAAGDGWSEFTPSAPGGGIRRATGVAGWLAPPPPPPVGCADPLENVGTLDLAGATPQDVTVADVDGDGNLDAIAVAGLGYVFLGDGSGGFGAAMTYPVGGSPTDVVAVDLDNDGSVDLATSNVFSSPVVVTLNNGDGTFAAPVGYSGSIVQARAITSADLDNDGFADLIAVNDGTKKLSVQLNNGDGTFDEQAAYDTEFGPYDVQTADFDGDGNQDVAVAYRTSDGVDVYLGNGDGTLAAPGFYATGDTAESLALGDVDGDGDVDIVTSNFGLFGGTGDSISLLRNNGDGTFAPQEETPVGSNPQDIELADIDGDGNLDVVLALETANTVVVLTNDGMGGFGSPAGTPAGTLPYELAVGDLDGNGTPDAISAQFLSRDLSVLLNRCDVSDPCLPDLDGDGMLTVFDFLAFQNLFGTGDLAADLDGDGVLTVFDFLEFQNLFAMGCG